MDSIVCLQPGKAGARPLYCFHPFGGSAAVYGPLAPHIHPELPVYGLQSVGLIPGREPDTGVTGMADRYAAEILHRSPPFPALLVGYSMGGIIAVETARRLPASPPVVLIDSDPLYNHDTVDPWGILVRQVFDIELENHGTSFRLASSAIATSRMGRKARRAGRAS